MTRTPVVLVTGVDADAMAATTVGLQFDLPFAVVLRHVLDVDAQRLTRVVSDMTTSTFSVVVSRKVAFPHLAYLSLRFARNSGVKMMSPDHICLLARRQSP